MKDYKKDFNDKLEDGSLCDGELISIANGYITEMQNIITELEKKNHEILKNSLDISNQFDGLEEKLANADYQLEGRDLKIKELEAEKDKAWWEGFDTCKAKAGEANVKLSDEITLLKAQIEKLIDFVLSKTECCDVCPITDTCINSEGTCPYAGILSKGEEEVTREWLMQKIAKEIKENDRRTL